ncbi:MAG: CoA pyrophosphatase [Wenzhouxiangella sp.]|nr:CoA pyrophosphatase [Wenzhouxiangella sp.]
MSDPDDRLDRLSSGLFSPDTPLDQLAVDGYRPPGEVVWRPRPAAVLVALIRSPEPSLVLTVRSDFLASHAGQVAFPGGSREGDEPFPVTTALREANEETGIEPVSVRVLGLMRQFDTITAYRVVPVVGVLETAPRFKPCPQEVRTVFTVPLDRALDPASYCRHQVRHRQREYEVWSMRSECWSVWGATAAVLAGLADLAAAG